MHCEATEAFTMIVDINFNCSCHLVCDFFVETSDDVSLDTQKVRMIYGQIEGKNYDSALNSLMSWGHCIPRWT